MLFPTDGEQAALSQSGIGAGVALARVVVVAGLGVVLVAVAGAVGKLVSSVYSTVLAVVAVGGRVGLAVIAVVVVGVVVGVVVVVTVAVVAGAVVVTVLLAGTEVVLAGRTQASGRPRGTDPPRIRYFQPRLLQTLYHPQTPGTHRSSSSCRGAAARCCTCSSNSCQQRRIPCSFRRMGSKQRCHSRGSAQVWRRHPHGQRGTGTPPLPTPPTNAIACC
jgi:hypothetical protein